MCPEENQSNPIIPKDADKTLFAEDFVNYHLRQFMLPRLSSGIADYRPFVYNAFNPTVSAVANILYRRLEQENLDAFENIVRAHPLNRDAFMSYVTPMELEYLSMGFDAQKLLHFCVKTATMAMYFYGSGFNEGPALAVQRITNILEDYDMSAGGWDTLNVIATNYALIYGDLDDPSDSDSEYETESASSSDSDDYSEASDSIAATTQESGGDMGKKDEQKFPESASDSVPSHSDEEEYSEASCSGSTSVETEEDDRSSHEDVQGEDDRSSHEDVQGEDDRSRHEDVQGKDDRSRLEDVQGGFPCSPSEFESQGPSDYANAFRSTNSDAEASSDDEAKYEDVQEQDSESTCSVYLSDTDGEYDSDVFLERADVITPCDPSERQLARKRPASSSPSACGFHMPDSAERPDTGLTPLSISASKKDLNASLPVSEGSAGTTHVKASPIRKHVAKTRKQC